MVQECPNQLDPVGWTMFDDTHQSWACRRLDVHLRSRSFARFILEWVWQTGEREKRKNQTEMSQIRIANVMSGYVGNIPGRIERLNMRQSVGAAIRETGSSHGNSLQNHFYERISVCPTLGMMTIFHCQSVIVDCICTGRARFTLIRAEVHAWFIQAAGNRVNRRKKINKIFGVIFIDRMKDQREKPITWWKTFSSEKRQRYPSICHLQWWCCRWSIGFWSRRELARSS